MWSLGTCFCVLEVFTKFLAQKAKIDPNIVLRIDEKTVFRSYLRKYAFLTICYLPRDG